MRLLLLSATYTFPEESVAIPCGLLNCPPPKPFDPHFVIKLPLLSNFWIRLLSLSTSYTLPEESIAIPTGKPNCPSPLPSEPSHGPHLVIKLSLESNFCTRF